MTALHRLRISMLKGWTIPRTMEWLFWPMGYQPPDPPVLVGGEGETLTFQAIIPAPTNIIPLARKFREIIVPGSKSFWERANDLARADARAAGRMANR